MVLRIRYSMRFDSDTRVIAAWDAVAQVAVIRGLDSKRRCWTHLAAGERLFGPGGEVVDPSTLPPMEV